MKIDEGEDNKKKNTIQKIFHEIEKKKTCEAAQNKEPSYKNNSQWLSIFYCQMVCSLIEMRTHSWNLTKGAKKTHTERNEPN